MLTSKVSKNEGEYGSRGTSSDGSTGTSLSVCSCWVLIKVLEAEHTYGKRHTAVYRFKVARERLRVRSNPFYHLYYLL